jgi:hypothetical protein
VSPNSQKNLDPDQDFIVSVTAKLLTFYGSDLSGVVRSILQSKKVPVLLQSSLLPFPACDAPDFTYIVPVSGKITYRGTVQCCLPVYTVLQF